MYIPETSWPRDDVPTGVIDGADQLGECRGELDARLATALSFFG
ncbi:hypothetical protein [Rhodococcus sp. NPDC060176]